MGCLLPSHNQAVEYDISMDGRGGRENEERELWFMCDKVESVSLSKVFFRPTRSWKGSKGPVYNVYECSFWSR
jgi:hypothetical protein